VYFLNSVHNYNSVTVAGYGSNDQNLMLLELLGALLSTSELKFITGESLIILLQANFNSFFSQVTETNGCLVQSVLVS
jgi:hypothetical protein